MSGDFLQICKERGFLHQCTSEEGLSAALANAPLTAYCGFDCTGKSLHAGSLLPIMLMRWFQKCGHKPLVLMGGATTKIGDPSGKDETRKILTDDIIADNMAGIKKVFDKYLQFGSGANDARMVNNIDWFEGKGYIEFLREIGPHFSINRMLSFDSVKLRLEREQTLSFLEFNYMILQAYDFVELNKQYGCRLQFGGSDQWGNIVNGVELSRRIHAEANDGTKELFGLTTPLLTTASGAKMGKTADGAIWLDAELLSPYEYWQYWRNTEDADVGRFLKLFTELPMDEIAKLEALEGAEINEAKKVLATEVTALCHGREAAEEAAKAATALFEKGANDANMPSITLNTADVGAEVPAFKLFQLAGLAGSGGEARRLIRGGGARINDEPIKDENALIPLTNDAKLSAGKKKHVRLILAA